MKKSAGKSDVGFGFEISCEKSTLLFLTHFYQPYTYVIESSFFGGLAG